tara:strand:- start:1488 stop:2066 length:579 start_codon:yes stop_codon:yes gene_type:complete
MQNSLNKNLSETKEVINKSLEDAELNKKFKEAVDLSIKSLSNDGSIYIAGNGGSASQADHFVGELVGRFHIEGDSLKVYSLNSNPVVITAIANDFSYEEIYSQQLNGQLKKNDLFIGISTSGNSKNINNAIDVCNKKGNDTILLTGSKSIEVSSNSSLVIRVPSENTPTIQEVHIVLLHSLAEEIEKALRNK